MNDAGHDERTTPPDGRSWPEQPRWRHDFPIDVTRDEYVSRRDFTRFMVLISSAFAAGQIWLVAQNYLRRRRGAPPIQEIGKLSALPVGGFRTFNYPREVDKCVLVRLDEQRIVAFDQACSHLSCPVIPRLEEKRFDCPCHKGAFAMETGQPLYGPPRRPLRAIRIEIAGDRILATGFA